MKNKGFTLVELLAVILIIGLIATIATTVITSIISTSKGKTCERQEEMIIDAAKKWTNDYMTQISELPYNLTIQTLVDGGYLTNKTLKNPKTGAEIDKDNSYVVITFDNTYNQYEYAYNLCN